MKVRVIAEDNIIISNMMMMMYLATENLAFAISSVAILGVCHDDGDDDDVNDDYRICPIVLNKGCVVLFLVQPLVEDEIACLPRRSHKAHRAKVIISI